VTFWSSSHCLHSCCIHICHSCHGPNGAATITDGAVTNFKLLAPFSDVLHSHYAITTHLYKPEVYISEEYIMPQWKALSCHQCPHSINFLMLLPLDIRGPNRWVTPQLHKQLQKARQRSAPQSLSERSLAAEPSVNQSHKISFENTVARVKISSWYSDSLRAGWSGDQIPVQVWFSAPVQTGSEACPASYTMGTGSLPGVKWLRCGIDHPPHLVPRLKKE
jgi:hypothetical protein